MTSTIVPSLTAYREPESRVWSSWKDPNLLLFISSGNCGFIPALADAIPAMGALETITFGDKQAVTMKADMIEADFSGKELRASGAIIVAAFLPKCQ